MKINLVLQGNKLTYENDAVSDITEMGHAFGDGEDGSEFCYARTWQDFIGRAFHLIQQTGGVLNLNGTQIGAVCFEDTDGSAVTNNTEIALANGKTVPISQLLNCL
jgi:hypothetical protein